MKLEQIESFDEEMLISDLWSAVADSCIGGFNRNGNLVRADMIKILRKNRVVFCRKKRIPRPTDRKQVS